ncbi:uroporphyrinogen-III synthase [Falsirhodobacter deserti]|uniref:uroporphyrinogen-III synthase n=1 Tax=Falsirhodobacter deserti TaxID=1365611 RepID=UPI000FE2EE38|nr:uroporphyrinogen-III synthase [Falsirhodobacter deserti]
MPPQSFATVLLTRPSEGSTRFAAMLEGPVILSPLLEPRILPADLPPASSLIFTSPTAVRAAGSPPATHAWCVGDRTAAVARQAGYAARSAAGDAEALFRAILASKEVGPLLHLRGRESKGDLARRLTEAGIPTAEAVVYEMVPRPLTEEARQALRGTSPIVVPLFSPASARRFMAEAPDAAAPLRFACLSDAVAHVLPNDAMAATAARPDAQAMCDLVTLLQRLETLPTEN